MAPHASTSAATLPVPAPYAVFSGSALIAGGSLEAVVLAAKRQLDAHPHAVVQIFDNESGQVVDVDYRGTDADVLGRLPAAPPVAGEPASDPTGERRGPGRPRLGVVAREVTLLPRHWEWLGTQPGGASVALRRLVDEARRTHAGRDARRRAQQAALHFMTTMAGNEAGYEEATRALYAGTRERFAACTATWPADVRDHARTLAARAFDDGEEAR